MESRSLKREDVEILTVWLGGRLWDASDLCACSLPSRLFCGYEYPFVGKGDIRSCGRPLREANELIKHALIENKPLAVFLITTWSVVEFAQKRKLNKRYEPNRPLLASLIPRSQLVFNYLIIMDGGNPKYWSSKKNNGPYYCEEKEAHRLGGVFLGYDTDAPTAGGRRLTELISRVMGYDLKSNLFPNYDFETLKKMAWHIKRESFNYGSPFIGAIPKYAFDKNGKPIFDSRLS